MTWIKFISWLTGLYACYYLLNIGWDLLRRKPAGGKESIPELHFEESVATRQVAPEQLEEKPSAVPQKANAEVATTAYGGVNVKDLFQLARMEVIAFSQSVTF